MLPEIKVGTYTGTGAALTSGINSIGFKPAIIHAFNKTDGDQVWMYHQGMDDATAIAIGTATNLIATQGCTLSATGFSLGTDATINETGKVYTYIAIGSN